MADPIFGNIDQGVGDPTRLGQNPGADPRHDPNYGPWKDASISSGGKIFFADGRWQQRTANGGAEDMMNPGDTSGLSNFVDGKTDIRGNPTPAELARRANAPLANPANNPQDAIAARMQAFIDSMLGPMNKNDPVYRGLVQAGTDAAQQSAGRGGLSGRSTLAGTQAASVAQQNVQPWMAARQGAGAQMLTQLSNRDISLGNLAQGQQQIDAGLAESKSNADKNFWSTLGSVGGGIVGGYFGGPGGAQAGAQIGGGIGGSLAGGGAGGPSYPQSSWKPGGSYKPPSGSGF